MEHNLDDIVVVVGFVGVKNRGVAKGFPVKGVCVIPKRY